MAPGFHVSNGRQLWAGCPRIHVSTLGSSPSAQQVGQELSDYHIEAMHAYEAGGMALRSNHTYRVRSLLVVSRTGPRRLTRAALRYFTFY